MYSPRISEDLIPIIYQNAREKKLSMTKYVDKIIRKHIIKGGKNKCLQDVK